ncbi:hypothetical protein PtrV1_12261 [Pyrenophora tritici-repentis]|nr:hypothetical protein PtrV1_12261 [Pyrenophora tritici-repentis]KAF7445059.1 hypothetical protein A1F99_100450 [Pyrenophora tritici-repentis]
MSTPSNSGLRRLVEYDKRNSSLPSLLNAPTVSDTASEAKADEPLAEACYKADSTTNAGRHLLSNKPGHSHGPNGPILIASCEGNIMGALAKS